MRRNYTISPLGDRAVIIEWEQQISEDIHRRVMQAFRQLQELHKPYILDLIPAYASLTVVYDAVVLYRELHGNAGEKIRELISATLEETAITAAALPRRLEIPVCYHPSLGPDLHAMAESKNVSPEHIIALHTAQTYTVYMLGFLPGFPYMGKVHDQLVTPRLKQPRLRVPAGSVGIAGAQTGIYPQESPGGWNIIGRTPLRLFDAGAETPCYCGPGDEVRFMPVSLEAFREMTHYI
ncbi:5-oxoprolinase subunit PxpB [Chitinophaga ginsengisegetis]|uniref:5-oxoprolinase subunit PxpB n=1 Tax=Chitinophaga ginsengisegetis TaxID=393003 RepID=UPI000DBA672C|nr:5-oxoprolinase subunit PxpB [Chitinophaga ginsengisegetis]MDR6571137.1 inhibitor of KinA [Chitinophaga ginsengisegetis]MDR6650871.1 inhibitor of KinA [Chitinophaga ginsengisegetis]MDR6657242.1 inhibitor of KinA [Chitinophaga ginsengisegetis]